MRPSTLVKLSLVALPAFTAPGPAQGQSDYIRLSLPDSVGVLLDGRGHTGCLDDVVLRSRSPVDVGPILPPAGCRSEVLVFGQGFPPLLVDAPAWSPWGGDTVDVAVIASEISIPIAAWLGEWGRDRDDLSMRFDVYRDVADMALFKSATGLSTDIIDRSAASPDSVRSVIALLTAHLYGAPCSVVHLQFRNAGLIDPDRVNVYVADVDARGYECDDVLLLGRRAFLDTFAHELGHVLSLQHLDEVLDLRAPGAPSDLVQNVMSRRRSGTGRGRYTTGQAFRMWLNQSSYTAMLKPMIVRRNCPDGERSPECLAIDLETWR